MHPIHSRLAVSFWRALLAGGLALLFLLLLTGGEPAPGQTYQVALVDAPSAPTIVIPAGLLALDLEEPGRV